MAAEEHTLDVKKLKVAELKKELADRGLSTKGNKGELQTRLQTALQGYVSGDDVGDHDVEDDLEHDLGEEVIKEDELEEDGKEEISQDESTLDITLPENGEAKEEKDPVESKPKLTALTSPATAEERRLQRLKRFGQQPSENDKKTARAQRFGSQSDDSSNPLGSALPGSKGMDVDRLKKRAERFGVVSPVITKIEESEKLRKRRERFGVSTAGGKTNDMTEAKKKRAERFGLTN